MKLHCLEPQDMTIDQAWQVRLWRRDYEWTWRQIASEGETRWGAPFVHTQLHGEDMCRLAAHLLGEDPETASWI